jgi:hypothetical protein
LLLIAVGLETADHHSQNWLEQFFDDIPAPVDFRVRDGDAHHGFADRHGAAGDAGEVAPHKAGQGGEQAAGGLGDSGGQVFPVLPVDHAVLPVQLLLRVVLHVGKQAPRQQQVDDAVGSLSGDGLDLYELLELHQALQEVPRKIGVERLSLGNLVFVSSEDPSIPAPHPLDEFVVPRRCLEEGHFPPEGLAAGLVEPDDGEEDLIGGDGVD